jgi:hypothetical protein
MNTNRVSSENSPVSPSTRGSPGRETSYAPNRIARRRWLGIVLTLVLAALVALVLLTREPLEPLPASAPAEAFSAERAFSHVERIAERPHPAGSAANLDVREYLVGQLAELGLRPTVRSTTAVQTADGIT